MPFTKRGIIIVSAAVVAAANQAALQLDPVGGQFTFTVGLSADGQEPISHYWCGAGFTDGGWEQVQQLAAAFPPGTVHLFENGEPEAVLSVMNLQRLRSEEL